MKQEIILNLEEHTVDSILRLSVLTGRSMDDIVDLAVDEYAGMLSVLEQEAEEARMEKREREMRYADYSDQE